MKNLFCRFYRSILLGGITALFPAVQASLWHKPNPAPKQVANPNLQNVRLGWLFLEGQQCLKSIAQNGKPVGLVMGPTGGGKSTFISAMTDIPLHKVNERVLEVSEDESEADGPDSSVYTIFDIGHLQGGRHAPKIGHNAHSETLAPSMYGRAEDDFCYCDTPGFFDNRNEADKIFAKEFPKQLFAAARMTKKQRRGRQQKKSKFYVKFLCLFFDRDALGGRGIVFREMIPHIGSLLQNFHNCGMSLDSIRASSFLFFNKCKNKQDIVQLKETLSHIIADLESHAARLARSIDPRPKSIKEAEAVTMFLQVFRNSDIQLKLLPSGILDKIPGKKNGKVSKTHYNKKKVFFLTSEKLLSALKEAKQKGKLPKNEELKRKLRNVFKNSPGFHRKNFGASPLLGPQDPFYGYVKTWVQHYRLLFGKQNVVNKELLTKQEALIKGYTQVEVLDKSINQTEADVARHKEIIDFMNKKKELCLVASHTYTQPDSLWDTVKRMLEKLHVPYHAWDYIPGSPIYQVQYGGAFGTITSRDVYKPSKKAEADKYRALGLSHKFEAASEVGEPDIESLTCTELDQKPPKEAYAIHSFYFSPTQSAGGKMALLLYTPENKTEESLQEVKRLQALQQEAEKKRNRLYEEQQEQQRRVAKTRGDQQDFTTILARNHDALLDHATSLRHIHNMSQEGLPKEEQRAFMPPHSFQKMHALVEGFYEGIGAHAGLLEPGRILFPRGVVWQTLAYAHEPFGSFVARIELLRFWKGKIFKQHRILKRALGSCLVDFDIWMQQTDQLFQGSKTLNQKQKALPFQAID